MSFGVSPDKEHTVMVGSDVAVTWVDKNTGKGYAIDYHLKDKSQCSGTRGSCPDTRLGNNTNSIRPLNAAMVNGYSIVTFQRPLKASDEFDLPILINASQAIVWGIGPLNQRNEVSFHTKYTKGDRFIDFGRQPIWNCPVPDGEMKVAGDDVSGPVVNDRIRESHDGNRRQLQKLEINRRGSQSRPATINEGDTDLPKRPVPTPKPAPKNDAWEIPPIQCYEPEDGVFYAQMGPTGGKHGYPAITGHVGWGISWYINGLLIPEINVVRGKTYTFVVEGGNDPDTPAKYHPFYITDDPVGGFEYKTEEEKVVRRDCNFGYVSLHIEFLLQNVRIFAGIHRSRSGAVVPTGIGRLCHWTSDLDGPSADDYSSFGAYQRSLTLKCDEGEPGIISWQPDANTPDTVYYQCFTHRHLGWKINVLDSCDSVQASEIDEVFVEPETDEDGLLLEASQRYETKIRPNEIFLLQHEKDLIKNHNMNEQPPKIQFDLSKNSEINKIIAEGIKAAEALEESIAKPKANQSITEHDNKNTQVIPSSNPVQSNSQPSVYSKEIQINNDGVTNSKLALSAYLRPPSVPSGPLFRPVQLPPRRPAVIVERRRPGNSPYRPFVVPQPSMIINHYKKPISPLIRPFVSQSKPIKTIAPFLVLGQSNEQYPLRKKFDQKTNRLPQSVEANIPAKPLYRDNLHTKAVPDQYQSKSSQKPFRDIPIKLTTKNVFKAPYKEEIVNRPYVHQNNGFQPGSVIVEGGFRPIINKRVDDDETEDLSDDDNRNRRRDDNVSDIEDHFEGDALFVNQDVESKQFEPMFIPSPLDSINTSNGKLLVNEKLMENMDVEDGEDKVMMAGERIDAYYLPPDNRKIPGRIYPAGSVVTYDGKAVLDYSLVNPLPPPLPSKNNFLFSSGHLSKTEQLIRNTPQFGPFQGEFPPLAPEFIPPEIMPNFRPTVQNPLPVTEYANPITTNTNPISTKLTLLKPAALVADHDQSDDSSVNTDDETNSDKTS
ncbi:Protein Skeletor, isoforms D/E [Pseudolycoriella hygida]|uniref:Protein Skeletor, isoforms D/E n=1 Tax=Pseudolycoriella hygida TaxID=35572 RepID=A0A9Q0MWP1_9DIPT|nr:Protein Skeletor, isoforms D/E [Pseudolycoriella hygida]